MLPTISLQSLMLYLKWINHVQPMPWSPCHFRARRLYPLLVTTLSTQQSDPNRFFELARDKDFTSLDLVRLNLHADYDSEHVFVYVAGGAISPCTADSAA